jgi:uncharacterized protein (TIGR02453 family)
MTATKTFTGFPADFFHFFRELAKHNERPWFERNKPRYQEVVVGSACAFIEAMAPRLAKISKHIVADPRPVGGSMFRIYRDVRFSKDKSPYKDHAGIHFRHAKGKGASAPGFYVHLAADEVFYGAGIWMPEPPSLAKIRKAIASDPRSWRAATGSAAFKKSFGEVRGEALVRPPKGFDPAHPLIETIKKKSFFAMHDSKPASAQSKRFLDEVETAFRAAAPLMKHLCGAVGVPF